MHFMFSIETPNIQARVEHANHSAQPFGLRIKGGMVQQTAHNDCYFTVGNVEKSNAVM
jgi:hypothetical protein